MLYLIHGLIIESEIELPLFKHKNSSDKVDITIHLAEIDEPTLNRNQLCSHITNRDDIWVNFPDIACFKVRAGKSIDISPNSPVNWDSIFLYLFGTVFGILLYQLNKLVLHSNAIQLGDNCILIAGESGAGKSTTAAFFHQQGFNILSDDVVTIDQKNEAAPGLPRIKLWQDTLEHLGINKNALQPVATQPGKYHYHLNYKNNTQQKGFPVVAIYILTKHQEKQNINQIILRNITGLEKFSTLMQHSYRNEFIQPLATQKSHLNSCAVLANSTYITEITRPSHYFCADNIVDTIIADLKSKQLYPVE